MSLWPRARLNFVVLCFAVLVTMPARAQNPQSSSHAPVRYVVSLDNRPDHVVEVKIVLGPGASERDLQLPVWNALYQIRDFSQYVNWVRARTSDGQPLPVHKVDKTTWRLGGAAQGAEIGYEIFADQSGPFGAQLNLQHAFFNLAEILMYPVGSRDSAVEISFTNLPAEWHIATALRESGDAFTAPDYDRMVDAPVEIGAFQEADFDEGGGHYRVIVDSDPSSYDMPVFTGREVSCSGGSFSGKKRSRRLRSSDFHSGPVTLAGSKRSSS